MNALVDRIANGTAQLLGIEDICTRLSISRTTFDRWVRNGGGKSVAGGKTTLLSALAGSQIGNHFEQMENLSEGRITFPSPDIRIGNSPKWELQTFKNWLKENAKPGS